MANKTVGSRNPVIVSYPDKGDQNWHTPLDSYNDRVLEKVNEIDASSVRSSTDATFNGEVIFTNKVGKSVSDNDQFVTNSEVTNQAGIIRSDLEGEIVALQDRLTAFIDILGDEDRDEFFAEFQDIPNLNLEPTSSRAIRSIAGFLDERITNLVPRGSIHPYYRNVSPSIQKWEQTGTNRNTRPDDDSLWIDDVSNGEWKQNPSDTAGWFKPLIDSGLYTKLDGKNPLPVFFGTRVVDGQTNCAVFVEDFTGKYLKGSFDSTEINTFDEGDNTARLLLADNLPDLTTDSEGNKFDKTESIKPVDITSEYSRCISYAGNRLGYLSYSSGFGTDRPAQSWTNDASYEISSGGTDPRYRDAGHITFLSTNWRTFGDAGQSRVEIDKARFDSTNYQDTGVAIDKNIGSSADDNLEFTYNNFDVYNYPVTQNSFEFYENNYFKMNHQWRGVKTFPKRNIRLDDNRVNKSVPFDIENNLNKRHISYFIKVV